VQPRIEVLARVSLNHPDVSDDDVRVAWLNALSVRTREFGPPDVIAATGADTKGRIIEMLGVEMEDDSVVVYHAMKLTQKNGA
jgi:hypothetical protein